MSRSTKFLSGLVLSYGHQFLVLIVGLWLTPFFLRRISTHDYGLWLVGTQLLTYLSLTDFGVVALLPLETAYATGRAGNASKAADLPYLVGHTVKVVFYQLPIVAMLASIIWFTVPAAWQGLKGPLGIVLIGFVFAFPLRILPALLEGLQDLGFISSMRILTWVLSTGATVAMVLAKWNLYALAAGWIISQCAPTPVYLYRLWKRFPNVLPRGLPPISWTGSQKQLNKGFWINVAQIAQLLMANTDVLIIGKLIGPAAVVPYACTGKLASVLANQANILMHTARPGLCELRSGESPENVFRPLVALGQGILTLSGLIFCVVLLINHWFVQWWVTEGQYGGLLLTGAILLNIIFTHWDTVAAYSVFCFGHQRRISLTNLGNGLVSVVAGIGLTMVLGLVGSPLGSLLGTVLIGLPCNIAIIARDIGVTKRRLVWEMFGKWCSRFVPLAAGFLFIAYLWQPQDWLQAAGAAGCATCVYLGVMIPNVMKSQLGDYLRVTLGKVRNSPRLSPGALGL